MSSSGAQQGVSSGDLSPKERARQLKQPEGGETGLKTAHARSWANKAGNERLIGALAIEPEQRILELGSVQGAQLRSFWTAQKM